MSVEDLFRLSNHPRRHPAAWAGEDPAQAAGVRCGGRHDMLARVAHRPSVILAGASLVMLGILLYVSRWMLFWWDEWSFIFNRPDPTPRAVLAPFLDTFVAVPVLVYDALLAVFGRRTYLPYLLVDWGAHFAAAFLLYRIVNRRSGVVLGLAAGISFVFL